MGIGAITHIKQFTLNKNQAVVGFDPVSLFTNVPQLETIDVIADCQRYSKLPKNLLFLLYF